jgi:hypothetical protein
MNKLKHLTLIVAFSAILALGLIEVDSSRSQDWMDDWPRLFTNHVVWIAVGALAVLQLIFVYAPFMQRLFSSAALEVRHWLVPLGIGLAIFLIVEAQKAIFRHFGAAETRLEPSSEDDAKDERRLSRRAYGQWEKAGRPDGREREFWSQAETELAAELKSGAAGKT